MSSKGNDVNRARDKSAMEALTLASQASSTLGLLALGDLMLQLLIDGGQIIQGLFDLTEVPGDGHTADGLMVAVI